MIGKVINILYITANVCWQVYSDVGRQVPLSSSATSDIRDQNSVDERFFEADYQESDGTYLLVSTLHPGKLSSCNAIITTLN